MAQQRNRIKIVECPRDAMQGWKHFIPTEKKIDYLNALLKVGFDTLDFGSFVSPKAIPQMADTAEVLEQLQYKESDTGLLGIVANERGAQEAVEKTAIRYLGYPFSISETFQLRNTNKTIEGSFELVRRMQDLCQKHGKELVIYISMGFGNPYGDPYDKDVVIHYVKQLTDLGIGTISLADTVGVAEPGDISWLFSHVTAAFPRIEFGAHFHSLPQTRVEKLEAAFTHGCRRFDVAINGIGGCPMAKDDLVGNIATETLLHFLETKNISTSIDTKAFSEAQAMATEIFRG